MNDNEVSLTIGGSVFKNWTSFSITNELNTISPAFSVGIVSNSMYLKNKITSGNSVKVKIGNDVVLTGYIEQTPVSYSATSANVGIAGRSKTCDLIDCTVMVDDPNISYEKPNTSNSNYVSCPQNAATEYKNVALETIIAQLIMPYGIKLVNETKPLTKKRNFSAKHEDTVLKALQNLTSTENLLFYGNENGDLVVTEKGKLTADDALVLGQNILTGDASFDASKIYKYYRAVGQDKGVTGKTGHAASSHNYTAVDDNVSRTRLLTKKVQGAADTAKSATKATNADKATHASTADSATKATQDSAGQQINSTYIKSLSVNGRTITYTKGNGSTGTITTQDTNTTYSKLSQFTNDSGYIVDSHNFASGVTVNGYKITVG